MRTAFGVRLWMCQGEVLLEAGPPLAAEAGSPGAADGEEHVLTLFEHLTGLVLDDVLESRFQVFARRPVSPTPHRRLP